MVNEDDNSGRLEFQIQIPDGTSKVSEAESRLVQKYWPRLRDMVVGFWRKAQMFLANSWKIGVDEPKKFVHCIKVALDLTLVSLFYYMRPLYDGVGGNAMWALLTVVVVVEYTVGATLYKCINTTIATILGGSLGLGVHWIASLAGEKAQPIIIGAGIFILAVAATFLRFIPTVKARFDYGALMLILTFSLVSVSGYRTDKLFMVAHQRISTILIGTSLCVLVSVFFCPVWAGDKLHSHTVENLENIADSLQGCIAEYFKTKEISGVNGEVYKKQLLQGYTVVLASKATEELIEGYATWEPPHGRFKFRHPWKQYLKIGAAARNCAYCIDSLNSCINIQMQAPERLKQLIREECMKLSIISSGVLKELARAIKTMKKSSNIEFSKAEMNFAAQELDKALKSISNDLAPPLPLQQTLEDCLVTDSLQAEKPMKASLIEEALTLATVVTLLTKTAARIEEIVDAVDKLETLAHFRTETDSNQSRQRRQMDCSRINPSEHDIE